MVTNGLAAAQKGRMKDSGIDKVVKRFLSPKKWVFKKPEKEFFDKVFEEIGLCDKSKAIILGDSLTSDMQGGKNAGIATCLYLGDNDYVDDENLCDFKIKDYNEFFSIVRYSRKNP